MPLPINPIIPIEFGDEILNAKATELLPWFTTGEQKAIYDLLKSYHAEDVYPALVQIEQWLNALQPDATKVPYTGAAADVDLGTHKLALDGLQLSLTPADPGVTEGRVVWNNVDGTIDVGLKGGNVNMQVGQEQFIRVVNKTGADLLESDYACVRINGAQGQRPKVALAQANAELSSVETIGLVTETIANNQEGFVTTSGIVRDINTTGSLQGETWVDGDVLYLSASVPGRVTKFRPAAPNHTVVVGYVIYAHANHGKIFVKVDNGYELDELHNVLITSPEDGQIVQFNATLGVWENKDLVVPESGDKNYRHVQATPSDTWTVSHNLNKYPAVTIIDSSGTVVEGGVAYNTVNSVTLTFQSPFSGEATFN